MMREANPWGLVVSEREPPDRAATLAARTGVAWVKHYLSPARCADPSYLDAAQRLLQALHRRGLRVCLNSGNPADATAAAFNTFLRHFQAALDHFAPWVQAWEVANEPNFPSGLRDNPAFPFCGPPVLPPHRYARLLIQASALVRRHGGDGLVVAGNVIYWAHRPAHAYVERLLRCIPRGTFDVFGYHLYGERPEIFHADVRHLHDALRQHHPGVPLWQNEAGLASRGDTTSFRSEGPWGPRIQAKYLLRRLLCDREDRADLSFYYKLCDSPAHDAATSAPDTSAAVRLRRNGFNYKGLHAPALGLAKPAAHALRHLARLGQSRWRGPTFTPVFQVLAEGSFAGIGGSDHRFPLRPAHVILDGSEGPVFCYWLPWPLQEHVVPARVSLHLPWTRFRAARLVNLLTGTRTTLTPLRRGTRAVFPALPLSDAPYAIAARPPA